jgi:hypothetical protein
MLSPSTTVVTRPSVLGTLSVDVLCRVWRQPEALTAKARATAAALFTLASLWDDDDTMIEFTDRAIEILRRSHVAARRFNPDAWIRVFRRGGSVEFALAEGADEGDVVMEEEEFRIAVEQGLEGVVAVREPHDQLFLRPIGSEPAPGEVVDAEGH